MNLTFSKYQGAGNDFVMVDNRDGNYSLSKDQIERLCDRRFGIGADGLILLENDIVADFQMTYYNSDGIDGSMCGNGGRCVVAFAKQLDIIKDHCNFVAYDGLHKAKCLEGGLVSLEMIDVHSVEKFNNAWKLDTGSPHLVFFKDSINEINVKELGSAIRNSNDFLEKGINVNFVQCKENHLFLRTYERGVEDETLSCGTGATASAIAAYEAGIVNTETIKVNVLGGLLEVSFSKQQNRYTNIYLVGEAKFVFNGHVDV